MTIVSQSSFIEVVHEPTDRSYRRDDDAIEHDDDEDCHNRDYSYSNDDPILIPDAVDEWIVTNDIGDKLIMPEFDEQHNEHSNGHEYRKKNGWLGYDLVHDRHSPVRILKYYVKYGRGLLSNDNTLNDNDSNQQMIVQHHDNDNGDTTSCRGGIDTTLTGIVYFSKFCESHKGYCHGGSMCSIMDDVIGWCSFLVTGQCKPWSGYTVQINTKLIHPISVYSILLVQATIHQIHGRKVYITAKLFAPPSSTSSHRQHHSETEQHKKSDHHHSNERLHATCEGIVVLNKGILPE